MALKASRRLPTRGGYTCIHLDGAPIRLKGSQNEEPELLRLAIRSLTAIVWNARRCRSLQNDVHVRVKAKSTNYTSVVHNLYFSVQPHTFLARIATSDMDLNIMTAQVVCSACDPNWDRAFVTAMSGRMPSFT
jgi:hypothetical protein